MRKGALLAVIGAALLQAGCSALETQWSHEGIGTELSGGDIANTTELQNIYLDHLCRQAQPYVGANVPSCAERVLTPLAWTAIVQAGMNDIDQRCDAYLSWLDRRKRENAAILTEIAAIRVAVDALVNPALISSVGPKTLAAVAAAFGLATSTLSNVNSLLLQVDHTTVQSVVFINRQNFREEILKIAIDNKPMAVHTLRSYLAICMPMTISANINSSVTVYQQTGTDGRPLVSTSTIAPTRARDPAGREPGRTAPDSITAFNAIIKDYQQNLNQFRPETVQRLQDRLCVSAPPKTVDATTPFHIAIFEASDMFKPEDNNLIKVDGKIDVDEKDVLLKSPNCPRNVVKNFYERTILKDGNPRNLRRNGKLLTVTDLINENIISGLKKVAVPGMQPVQDNTPMGELRKRIKAVREELMKKPEFAQQLKPIDPSMSDQWTPDLQRILDGM